VEGGDYPTHEGRGGSRQRGNGRIRSRWEDCTTCREGIRRLMEGPKEEPTKAQRSLRYFERCIIACTMKCVLRAIKHIYFITIINHMHACRHVDSVRVERKITRIKTPVLCLGFSCSGFLPSQLLRPRGFGFLLCVNECRNACEGSLRFGRIS
jgi:hypothetical protein